MKEIYCERCGKEFEDKKSISSKFFCTKKCLDEYYQQDNISRELVIERIKYEIEKLSKMRHSDKKHFDSILWMHIREAERRLLRDIGDAR